MRLLYALTVLLRNDNVWALSSGYILMIGAAGETA